MELLDRKMVKLSLPMTSVPPMCGAAGNDSKLASNGNSKQNMTLLTRLAIRTHFSENEVASLLCMHSRMVSQGALDMFRFREIIHACFDIFDDMMLDRTFRAFDKDYNGYVSAIEWVQGCSILLRGTPEELIAYSYFIYDLDGDGNIAREEIQRYLKKSIFHVRNVLIPEEIEEGEKDIIDYAMKKLDKDHDGFVSFKDYEKACYKDPILIQALGHCIPSPKSSAAFMACFTENYRNYTSIPGDRWRKDSTHHHKKTPDYHLGPSHGKLSRLIEASSLSANGTRKVTISSDVEKKNSVTFSPAYEGGEEAKTSRTSGTSGTSGKSRARKGFTGPEHTNSREKRFSQQVRVADRVMKIFLNRAQNIKNRKSKLI